MEMTVTQDQDAVPVTVLHLAGKLDGGSYEALIAKAHELFEQGIRNLLLDLSQLTYLSSAGISALHRVALLFQGKESTQLEEGWAAFHAMDRDRDSGVQQHVKLLNPTQEVAKILGLVGFTTFFEIYNDLHSAVVSFQ
jgi:anti-anti-sigma factor